MTLEEAFSLKGQEVIGLVGGGGKTALMFALGRELSIHKKGILLTTTTKIWDPIPSVEFALFCSEKIDEMRKWIRENLGRYRYLLLARERLNNGKLQGIPPDWTLELSSLPGVTHIIVEADGAAGRSVKAPREGEPVLPLGMTLLVPVVGIDALGSTLDEAHVFRSRIASEILDQPGGAIITEKMIAGLVRINLKKMPENARVVPFLNKVDLPDGVEKGRNLARVLIRTLSPRVEKVVLGRAQGPNPFADIVIS